MRLDFPELTEEGDSPVHLVVKNPKTLPLHEIQPTDVALDPDGTPNEESMRDAMYAIIAHMSKAGYLYDGSDGDIDEFGQETGQRRLEFPLKPQDVATLPWEIVNAVAKLIRTVTNPS